jgi:hypothetical protein
MSTRVAVNTLNQPALKNGLTTLMQEPPATHGRVAETHGNEVLHHIHVWKRVDLRDFVEVCVDPPGAC